MASAQHLVTKTTWMTIEIAINGLIYWVSCMPRWPRELWVYVQSSFSLRDLSVISLWLILGEEFSWKKSFNKARTIFSLSGQREGHHLCFCLIFIVCPSFSVCISAWPWACGVTSISPEGTHQSRFVLALWKDALEMESSRKRGKVL